MIAAFYLISVVLIVSAVLAVSLRNLIYCTLCASVVFISSAALFFLLKADFIGVVQILIYVGAVATLLLFAVMLTKNLVSRQYYVGQKRKWSYGIFTASAVLWVLIGSIRSQTNLAELVTADHQLSVVSLGKEMLTAFLLPFEVASLLLTAAMIGGIVIALEEKKKSS
ncbi:MAG: NADH-quinone oxidoreductase subunit J [Candidatus Omnitrophica bacterium]|nr:NADH-quinone oxidoreductase subunit J [Candidatus Omnitrophota bacterium]